MTVVNKITHTPTPNDVYIGRGSVWGNPYILGAHIKGVKQTRDMVIARYTMLMHDRLNDDKHDNASWLASLKTLNGKTLVCYCAPQACHGDVLEALVEEMMA